MQLKLYKNTTTGLSDMLHLEIARNGNDTNKKKLSDKILGKFYTPNLMGRSLVDGILNNFSQLSRKISLIDPFCGDGRLIVWLLEKINNTKFDSLDEIEVTLWDCDENAILQAKKNIANISRMISIPVTVNAKVVDTFFEFTQNDFTNKYDIVITNPPWDVVKPDKSELQHLNSIQKEEYIRSLKIFSNRIKEDYPLSSPDKMYGGWGINLARTGTEIAIKLAKPNGVVGLVSPASLLADQNSTTFRKWILENNHSKEINYYPAESRLFDSVDSPSVTIVLVKGALQNGILLNKFDKNLKTIINEKIELPVSFLKKTDYKIPISFGSKSKHIKQLINFQSLPNMAMLQDEKYGSLWSGRELNETNYRSWTSLSGSYGFLKGRMINRFSNIDSSDLYIKNEKVVSVPESVNYSRIVWRDVSRPTQKRRIIATIVAPGFVTGNSLGVAYFKNDDGNLKLFALLGIISSLIFEFQVRALLATSHISVGVLRKTGIPSFKDHSFIKELANLVKKRIDGDEHIELEIETLVAKSYGLSKDDYIDILEAFPKLTKEFKKNLVKRY